jgi:hypothetical protein
MLEAIVGHRWTAIQVLSSDKNFLQGHRPVHASTYVGNVAGQVRPLPQAPAGCGFDFLEPT